MYKVNLLILKESVANYTVSHTILLSFYIYIYMPLPQHRVDIGNFFGNRSHTVRGKNRYTGRGSKYYISL